MARLTTGATTVPATPARPRTQRTKKAQLPEEADSLLSDLAFLSLKPPDQPRADTRKTPRRSAKKKVVYAVSDDEAPRKGWSDEDSAGDVSDFVVPDSASEAELRRPPRSMRKEAQKTPRRLVRKKDLKVGDDETRRSDSESAAGLGEQSPSKRGSSRNPLQDRPISFQPWPILDPFEGPTKVDRPSPRKPSSPRKASLELRFVTPPTSPTKPKLRSPIKSALRIPASPHRPSIDAFWSQDVINAWNDEYSPTKTPGKTPRARRVLDLDDDGYASPSEARQRSPTKTPRRGREEAERRRKFDAEKESLAAAFLAELDAAITHHQLAQLAASTGGVRIVWSRKLNSTAGRANWKRETIRPRALPSSSPAPSTAPAPPPPPPIVRHHACIELAAKVIDDADRLRNVLAHEFCHLANFMLSGVTDAPHGRSFQRWGAQVTARFADRGIEVTTRHAYEIAYRYAWDCAQCGATFQRHSRSIDPARHTCGTCGGVLAQVRPPPRKAVDGAAGLGEAKAASPYQAFVKLWYAEVKKENAGWSMGQVMAELARRYRQEKEDGKVKRNSGGMHVKERGFARAKRQSIMPNEEVEEEEVVVLETDGDGVGQVGEKGERSSDLDLDLASLSLSGQGVL